MGALEDAARAASPTRCAASTRLYRDGRLVAAGFDVAEVSEHLADPACAVWLDLLQPDDADMAVLVDELGLHPLAIEDALHAHQRPKLDRYRDHHFLAAYAVRLVGDEVEPAEVSAFITPRALVTVRKDPAVPLEPVLARWDSSPTLARAGVPFLLHGLLDVLVDGYGEVVQDLEDRVEDLEDALFDPASSDVDLQR
ncbi:MAG TPA: CorA family divalent cation transporter, partial [Mycobacteriales bacterium]|nr:CorA family divalent cation transporter [Mycobacteriales bacterium]